MFLASAKKSCPSLNWGYRILDFYNFHCNFRQFCANFWPYNRLEHHWGWNLANSKRCLQSYTWQWPPLYFTLPKHIRHQIPRALMFILTWSCIMPWMHPSLHSSPPLFDSDGSSMFWCLLRAKADIDREMYVCAYTHLVYKYPQIYTYRHRVLFNKMR